MSHLYLHIPFCEHRCGYCDFVSSEDLSFVDVYVSALIKEIGLLHKKHPTPLKTVYFGGGTPSILSAIHFERIISKIKSTFGLPSEEFTVEVNPESVSKEKMTALVRLGVNRVSMGMQAKQTRLLEVLERRATFETVVDAYGLIRSSGIKNISLDLIYGIPGQTLDDVEESLQAIIELSPEHVSTYALKVEPETPMARELEKGLISMLDDDTYADQLDLIIETLENKGYVRYEISNFSKPSYESKHNMSYWRGVTTLGVGMGAVYLLGNERVENIKTMGTYLNMLDDNKLPIDNKVILDAEERLYEALLLGFRLKEGIDTSLIGERFDVDFEEVYAEWARKYIGYGLLEKTDRGYRLTNQGMNIANVLLMEL
ncbi:MULTISPECIES: radical SAM family heme chaperone HemW [unclassified Fusibacter]|uniref:radical SAM family heme chaperone HemW n=1 Tax=unclassified Fusibacter TaxID=2624464 RepID=UPI001010428A|nr:MULTISPECIES: radical SAM family heme chaperone HemW [unclassified Fusibacter]MCK8058013.1 radical SAM family heme chaperone HemW [Fusibacter sp. A2]NPE20595.1 radical SAM family heme chaperone HemW [Fusibacter sp. A1]RXV62802.1 coproporphyrinogen III oxidase family protein [Fusibacter sp. A1]